MTSTPLGRQPRSSSGSTASCRNYRRILDHGRAVTPAELAIVGDEESVANQVNELFEAGATDVWAAPFIVGEDRRASRARTRALLEELAAA